jgi:hypothetical protein
VVKIRIVLAEDEGSMLVSMYQTTLCHNLENHNVICIKNVLVN